MSTISNAVQGKRNQWDREAQINACRAIQAGRAAFLVTYPTGKQAMRFAEPYKDYGMHYEVSPETWAKLLLDPHVYV